MGHTLLNILQKVFAGKTSARAKILMILCSNIFISPIQQSVYSEFCSLHTTVLESRCCLSPRPSRQLTPTFVPPPAR